ncbi:polymorphic toxin-type HINT domain-containing protein [Streptomyces sp. NPDC086787]|uniref:polymorphic toxin-type HINT domain-containing protein n=1 Tax=Streptomyces sp. NPDC086787 TaxID=3365759 RepID=UPI0038113897
MALASAALLAGSLTDATVADAAKKPELWSPFPLSAMRSVNVTPADARPDSLHSTPMKSFQPAAPKWPAATSATVDLPTTTAQDAQRAGKALTSKTAKSPSGGVSVTGTPVTLGQPGTLDRGLLPAAAARNHALARKTASQATTGHVNVSVAPHSTAQKAGVDGLAVSLLRTGQGAGDGRVAVALDYGAVRDAFGGDYATRLRLVELPACALTTPDKAACRVQKPVATSANDFARHRLVAEVALPAAQANAAGKAKPSVSAASAPAAVVLAATASASGAAGTYAATSLSPSGKWGVSGNTGAFTYSYPISVPPSVGGMAPGVALSYNSASVDGRTSATNNQASWVGDGWDYAPGFVERSYKSCADDGQTNDGNECWAGDNATISVAGHSGELVPTGKKNTAGNPVWRLSGDDGSVVEQVSGASNGLQGGTYWRLTDNHGMQYYFGADHLPSGAGGDGKDTSTNAAWGAPVYGDDAGEPCHGTTLAASQCTQGWRWNLDFVIDTHKNITTYAYTAETNYYGRGSTHTLTAYTRAGYPSTISYGQQVGDYVAKKTPAAQVVFTAAQRCDGKNSVDCTKAPVTATASHWPDTPFDQNCASTGTCTNYTPTYWSTMRLAAITTKVWDQSLATPAWSTVDTYTLTQSYPDPGDGTKPAMWLESVKHTGADTRGGGTAQTLPTMTLQGKATVPNRVDGLEEPQNIPPINRYRLQSLTTETGSVITVAYKTSSCSRTSPPKEDADTQACYPVRWTPPGYTAPILDWFYTYPVTEIDESDATTAKSTPHVTTYEYKGGAAWHHDDSELTVDKYRTWNQFRGYAQVVTRTGTGSDPVTEEVTDYLRGMDGNATADGGTTSVKVTDAVGDTLTDDNALSGHGYQTTVYDKDGGSPRSQTVNHPWMSPVTATHPRGGKLPDLTARFTDTDRVDVRALKADGTWRTSETTTTFDNGTGLPTQTDDKGEIGTDGRPVSGTTTPENCTTTTYATDASRNMYAFPAETITEAGGCVTKADAHTLADAQTWYDKSTTLGSLPSTGAGDATSARKAKSVDNQGNVTWVNASTTEYDTYGRVTKSTDPLGRWTSTVYTDNSTTKATKAKYLPVTTVSANSNGWSRTTTIDPGRQLPLTVTDPSKRVTTETYDGLGRLTSVWLPDHTKAANPSTPSGKYTYFVSQSAPSYVESQQYTDGGEYTATYQIYDGLLQLRQTQSTPLNGGTGRLITDTAYDSHGWATTANAAYFNKDTSAPTGTLVTPVDAQVPSTVRTTYDGQGRPVTGTLYSLGRQQWQTSTAYPGIDETDVTPLTGGTPTAAITDARGKTTELRQFHGSKPTGSYDKTVYDYDAAGEMLRTVGPLAADAATGDDAAKKVTWTSTYDLLGQVTTRTDPDTGTSRVSYDDDGEVTETSTDGLTETGHLYTTYDSLGRVTDTWGWDAKTAQKVKLSHRDYYDAATDTALGQPKSITVYEAGKAVRTSTVTGYTTAYQPTGATISIPAGAYGNTAAITYTTTNKYTSVQDLPSTVQIASTGTGSLIADEKISYSYNGTGLPVSNGGTDTYTAYIDYSPLGQTTRTTMGVMPRQVVTTDAWEQATGRLLTHTVNKEDGTSPVDQVNYTYNQAGQITSTSDVQDAGGTANTDTQCYRYDYLNRLTDAWTDTGSTHTEASPTINGIGGCTNTAPDAHNLGGPAPYWQSYTYDLTGNRTAKTAHDLTGNAAKDVTTDEHFDLTGHTHAVHTATTSGTTRTYSYDQAGNPTTIATTTDGTAQPDQDQAYAWNSLGKLDTLTTGPTESPKHRSGYHYDDAGNLIARTDDGKTTLYLGSDQLTLTDGTVTAANRYYTLADAPTAVRTATAGTSGSKLSYQTADPQGTATDDITADTLTVTRRPVTPFGETRGTAPTAWPGDHGFVGGTIDQTTGLTNIGAREYDPALGRFISPDALLNTADPQSFNGYAYADNSPVTFSDPTGLWLDDGTGHNEPRYDGGPSGPTSPHPGTASGKGKWTVNDTRSTSNKTNQTIAVVTRARDHYMHDAVQRQKWSDKFRANIALLQRNNWTMIPEEYYAAAANACYEVECPEGMKHFFADGWTDYIGANYAGPDGGPHMAEGSFASLRDKFERNEKVEKSGASSVRDPCANSFNPDTPVLLAQGKTKAIGKIKPGDKVEVADPDTGKDKGARTVTATHVNHDYDLIDLRIRQSDGTTDTLHTTAKHPFWDDTLHTWIPAGKLKPGHALNTVTNQHVHVVAITVRPGDRDMYNLTVDDLHTYYVLAGATPILVHNSGGGVCGVTALEQGDWQHIVDRHRPGGALLDDEAGILIGKEKIVRRRISETINRGTPRANTGGRPGQIYEWNFGTPVGKAGPANGGGDLMNIRVVVNEGKVVTAFPF